MKQRFQVFIKSLGRQKKTILLIVTFVLATVLLSIAISLWLYKPITETLYQTFDQRLPSYVTIRTIDVRAYWDRNLQNETTQIQWPTMYVGASSNVTLFIQSVSNVNTTLTLQTTNWAFLNSDGTIVSGPANTTDYIHLTWDYNNTTLTPKQTVRVELTLTTDNSNDFVWFLINNNATQFSFDIIISANESS